MRLTPGIRIVNVPSPLDDGLPVMDVPVFVGFAERGPVDRPVALEDPTQYAAVFGGPLDLVPRPAAAGDALAGAPMQRAHLPAAVASFFAGGGRRCYVIRVTGAAGDAFFPVAGLRLATRSVRGAPWQLAATDFRLRTASPGAWADRHELAARLASEPLQGQAAVRTGDLLRARHPGHPERLGWLRVERPGLLGERIKAADAADWLWTGAGNPPLPVNANDWLIERLRLDLALRHPEQPEIRRTACGLASGADNLPWFTGDAAARFDAGEPLPGADWPLAGPGDAAPDHWLLLPLASGPFFADWQAAQHDGRDSLARNGLAAYSPALFVDPAWRDNLQDSALLRWADEIRHFSATPRRLGGLHGALGRDDAVSRDATWIAVPDAVHPGWRRTEPPSARNGLLLATPDAPCDCEPETAFDACQPPPRIPQPPRFDLAALRPAAEAAAVAPADVAWYIRASAEAESAPLSFEVEIAQRADFSDARPLPVVSPAPDQIPLWTPAPGQQGCEQAAVKVGERHFAPASYVLRLAPGLHHLRARVWRQGRYSGWSAPVEVQAQDGQLLATPDEACDCEPETAFDACLPPPPRIPRPPRFDLATLRPAAAAAALVPADVAWHIQANAAEEDAPLSFEVEIAQRADFSDARPLPVVAPAPDATPPWTPAPGQRGCVQAAVKVGECHFAPASYVLRLAPGLHHLRARVWRQGRYSDWSAPAEVLAQTSGWQLHDTGDAVPRTVHSALIRLCAATREHFALLSVPESWDAARLAAHVAFLRQQAEAGFAATQAASFAALHHPWLVRREAASFAAGPNDGAGELHAHPPEGAVLGLYARRSRQRGAWAAAGLEPLAEAFALSGRIDAEAIEAAYANAIEQRPSGIAATRANTLADDPDWQAVGVRRLFILLRRLARREGERYVFEPNDLTLRRSLEGSFEAQLRRLMQRGAFRGASAAESYRLATASGARADEEIERGECSMEIRVAPSRPLRFLTLRVLRAGEQLLIEER